MSHRYVWFIEDVEISDRLLKPFKGKIVQILGYSHILPFGADISIVCHTTNHHNKHSIDDDVEEEEWSSKQQHNCVSHVPQDQDETFAEDTKVSISGNKSLETSMSLTALRYA